MPDTNVTIIEWPHDAARLERLRRAAAPRIIAVPRGLTPPALRVDDDLEDWVRWPAPADEVAARASRLAERAEAFATVDGARGD